MLGTVARGIYLGLRSNVRFFASQAGFAKLTNRAKGLSLLYDRLLLQDGVYEASVGDGGAMQFVGPLVGPFQLKPRRSRRGVPFGIRMAPTGSDDFHTVMATTNVQSYRAQFITLANEMTQGKANWFDVGTVVDPSEQQAKDLAERWNRDEVELPKAVWPALHPRLRTMIHENLNLDLATSAVIGAHLAPDALHQPLLHAKAAAKLVELHGSGERTLWVVLPTIGEASWEDIAELRRDPGLSDLRSKLAEADDAALEGEDVYQTTLNKALDEADHRRPRWFASGLWAVVNLMSGPIAPALSAAGLAANVGRSWRADRTWTAALVRARQRLHRSAREKEWLRLS
jgi:hypothetical protein